MSRPMSQRAALDLGGSRSRHRRADSHVLGMQTGVSIDSRSVEAGDLFVALAGPNHDGHDYVQAAFRPRGGGGDGEFVNPSSNPKTRRCCSSWIPSRASAPWPTRPVNGAKPTSLRSPAASARPAPRRCLRCALGSCGVTVASAGNLNNHIGVPLSLARLPRGAAYGVFEVGMNHPGEIGPLSRLARPHTALITTIVAAHTEFFTSLDAVADAKAEIFEGLEPGGTAVLNRDNTYFDRVGRRRAQGRRGTHPVVRREPARRCAAARLASCRHRGQGRCLDRRRRVRVRHRVLRPALGVEQCGPCWPASAPPARRSSLRPRGLCAVGPGAGRGERRRIPVAGGFCELIDESYNASPAAVRAAIATLAESAPLTPGGRRIAVLGDMLELGEAAERWHAELSGDLEAAGIDLVFTAGSLDGLPPPRPRPCPARRLRRPDSAGLTDALRAELRAGDVVLIKGSLGSRMKLIISRLTADATAAPRS